MRCPECPNVLLTKPYLKIGRGIEVSFEYPESQGYQIVFENGTDVIRLSPDEARGLFQWFQDKGKSGSAQLSASHQASLCAKTEEDEPDCKIFSHVDGTSVTVDLNFLHLLQQDLTAVLRDDAHPSMLDTIESFDNCFCQEI